jgi:putative endonuclease
MAPIGPSSRGSVGSDKERLACAFLEGRGLRLLSRNYRCRQGEIDLVMREADTLVFVEVRFRRSDRFGTAAETVDVHKQRRLAAAASHYLQRHPTRLPCRFDVLAVSGGDRVDWIKDAFHVE